MYGGVVDCDERQQVGALVGVVRGVVRNPRDRPLRHSATTHKFVSTLPDHPAVLLDEIHRCIDIRLVTVIPASDNTVAIGVDMSKQTGASTPNILSIQK